MKHITDIIVYKNRCEVIQSHSYTEGDIGAPHLRMIFDYMFERDSLKGLTLECKYILPSGEYSIKNVEITEDKEVLFPIYYSVFEHSGWTTLKATLVDENNRITLDDIVLRVKKLNTDNVHENKQFDNMLESEVKIEVQTITDAIKKEIDDYVKINKETLKGEPGVVDYSKVTLKRKYSTSPIDLNELIKDGLYSAYRWENSKLNALGVVDVKSYQPDWLIQKQYIPHWNGEYYEYARTRFNGGYWSDWVEIWHSGNLDLQNLQPITIDSSVGNHVILKRSGELKGSLTSNQDSVALYNEKSGKMIELKDDGDVIIPAENLQTESKNIVDAINELLQEIKKLKGDETHEN